MKRALFSPSTTRLLEIGCTGAVLVLYMLLKAKTLRITSGDEGVYFYAAKLWLSGVLPYRDFFISHPPVHLIVPTIAMALFGVNIPLFNALSSLFVSTLSGFLTFCIARRAWGYLAGFLALLLFLFSNNHLLHSNHETGVHITLLLILVGVDRLLAAEKSVKPEHSALLSGMFLGLAMMAGAYALPAFLLLGGFTLCTNPRMLRPLATGFGLIVVPLHLFFLALAGNAFLLDVYLYHMGKVANSPYFANVPSVLYTFLIEERWLALPALLGLHVLLLSVLRGKSGVLRSPRLAILSILFAIDYFLFFSLLHRVFRHYLILTLPFAAIVAAYGLLSVLRFRFRPSWKYWPLPASRALLALGVGGFSCWALLASIAPYARIAFSYSFTGAYDIALHAKKTLQPGETLYGDFGVTPTVALLSGIRIAANEVDSSIMRFESAFSPLTETLAAIERDHVGALILRRGTDIEVYPPFREYLLDYYVLETEFVGADSTGDVLFWRRKKEMPYRG